MRQTRQLRLIVPLLSLGLAACANLDVRNPNAPDRERALSTGADAEALVAGAHNTWFKGVYAYYGPGAFLSVQAFQHSSPWSCCGMEYFGRLPREPIRNDPGDIFYGNWTSPWSGSYAAIAAAANALRAMAQPTVASQLGSNVARDRAFGYFVLGLGHATIAVIYDQGFVADETVDVSTPQKARPYADVMAAAMGYFDRALALTNGAGFTIPTTWIPTDAQLRGADFARLIHSLKARYLVEVARTPAERAAVDWGGVVREIDAGITESFIEDMDWNQGWYWEAGDYSTMPGWSQLNYFVWGMADQSGNYQLWLNTPLPDRRPSLGGKDILIVTPDLRFPRGATVADQTARKGKYVVVPTEDEYGSTPAGVWARPDHGTWRWSYYYDSRSYAYNTMTDFHMEEIPISEMNLLKAEGLYRRGDRAGAAALVNISRVGIGGLNPTDAGGSNTSCVPKLPDGRCGDLWEMIKWEKRMEGAFQGALFIAPWFFDSRGWGDLYKGTPLQWPIPCREAQVLGLLPCYTFGGPSEAFAAPVSSYRYPGET